MTHTKGDSGVDEKQPAYKRSPLSLDTSRFPAKNPATVWRSERKECQSKLDIRQWTAGTAHCILKTENCAVLVKS